ncbi:MAG: thermonuclease family protein [Verrucomicrobia bacterium]|nr:thermonuclease family protein [Verrucomicrobiota bacterium]
MPRVPSSVAPVPRTYAELRHDVQRVIGAGRRQVEVAWVMTFHETGRLIHEHVLLKKDRADYGTRVFVRLASDIGVSSRTLQECVQFYRCYRIPRPVAEFGWNRCRLLCQVTDEVRRDALAVQLRRGPIPTAELKRQVRALNAAARLAAPRTADDAAAPTGPAVKLLRPRLGTAGLHRVVARDGGMAVDVGFKLYLPLTPAQAGGLRAGAIVRCDNGGIRVDAEAGPADLFTYRATVRRVIDGDTLAVTIALPHYVMDEKLRLRGIDCPEMDTAEGQAAKRFTESLLAGAADVIITTSKVDKYDRYLADVHLRRADGTAIFLNNELLKNRHAVPMGAEAMDEWVP